MDETGRRFATILAADAVAASWLSSADDPDVARAAAACLVLAKRLIDEHGGLAFDRGDRALIAEFPNVAGAVRAAVAIQQAIARLDADPAFERYALLRLGLSIGDVDDGATGPEGEAVDMAGGLAAVAVAGGICLARSVYEHVRNRVHVGFQYSGEKQIRGSTDPVAIYQIVEPGVERGYFSIWEELRRRSVFRVGAAYAVVAWLLIQAASIALPAFGSPRWVLQAFIAVAILGFPVALVLAWLYELTPMGLKRSDEVLRQANSSSLIGKRLNVAIMALLVIAVVVLIVENYVITDPSDSAAAGPDSIAVLAFENFSPDPNDEYFADGLADELLSVLGRVRELKVASRTASFYFKGKDIDVATIASTLMVGYVLSGGVRRYGDRIRVTAALDDAGSGNLLWSETYDSDLDDILDVQSQIAQSVATAIVPVLSVESEQRILTRPTTSSEAYDFYLRARDYLRQPGESATLASAIQLFDRAIDVDPRFAAAYAGLCEAEINSYTLSARTESFERAESACHRALTLDDGLWEVRVALGDLYRASGRYDEAVLELQSAIAQQPKATSPYLSLAQSYAAQQLYDQAEAMFRRAEQVESGYWAVHNMFGNFLFDLGRFDEAIGRHQRVIELTPDSGIGYDNLGNTYLAIGELDQAEVTFDASPLPSRWTYMNRGLVHYYRSQYEAAVADEQQAIDLAPDVPEPWGFLADAYRFIPGGERNAQTAYAKAIELTEKALALNPSDWRRVGWLGVYFAHSGRAEQAAAQLDAILQHDEHPDAYYFASQIALSLGEPEAALDYLEAVIGKGWTRGLLRLDPDLATLRGNPRYAAVLTPPAD